MLALLTAWAVALAHHLGLVGKVSDVIREIAGCCRCSVFWCVLGVLIMNGVNIYIAAASAILLAYLADWLGLLFFTTGNLYNKVWQKIHNRSRNRSRKR